MRVNCKANSDILSKWKQMNKYVWSVLLLLLLFFFILFFFTEHDIYRKILHLCIWYYYVFVFFFFYMYHVNTLVYQYGLSRFISMVYQELSMIYHSVPWYISKCHGFTIWNLHCVPQQNFSLTVSRNHMIHWHIPHHKNHLS